MKTQNLVSEEIQGIKYLGLFKPCINYDLTNDLTIVPADAEMVNYGNNSIRNNISYLTTKNTSKIDELQFIYRQWIIFDSLIFNDDSPIRAFDNQKTGYLMKIPTINKTQMINDYWQQDYNNIAAAMYGVAPDAVGLPIVNYSETYQKYLSLNQKMRVLIEWFISFPKYMAQIYCRPDSFFNPNYWQILNTIILIEQLIGMPPPCADSPKKCVCGKDLHPHHLKSRNEWLKEYLINQIDDLSIANSYMELISTAYKVRNSIAHSPQFDRLTHEAPEKPEIYDITRAAESYKKDSAALMLLIIMSLTEVGRNLLFKSAFIFNFFPPLRKLTSFPVK